jgi:hypothetical protein
MKIRHPLALTAAALAAGLASGQQAQIQFQAVEKRAYPAQPAQPSTTSNEYKPPANTDPDPKSLNVPDDLQKQAKDLVGKLGSPVYAEREKATRELAKMGRMALPALHEALGSATEPEVALRAEGLLPKAEAEDMRARVASFLADSEGKYQHTLPGWEKFKAVCGNDRASRKLFAEMLKSTLTHQMLLAAEKSAEEANGVLNQYVTRLWNQQNNFRGGFGGGGFDTGGGVAQPAKLPDLVAALFLESQFTDREVVVQATIPWGWGGQGNQSVANYVHNVSEVSNAIYSGSGEYSAPIRKIVIQWMDSRETAQQAYQAYNFAQSIYSSDRKKTIKYACRVLEAEGGPNGSYNKLNILQTLSNNQAELKAVIPSIAKCFDDSLLIWNWQNGNPGFDIQLRDYALAYALQVTDQKPEDYGMSRNSGSGTGKVLNQQQAFYFKDDTPPKNPGGIGGGIRGGRGGKLVEVEEPKKEEPKKEEPKDPKDPKKEEVKKLSQEDRRKAAFKKWDEWVKDGGLTNEKKDPKADPKKDETKKDGPKPEDKKPDAAKKDGTTAVEDAKKEAEALKLKEEAAKKEAEKRKDAEKK